MKKKFFISIIFIILIILFYILLNKNGAIFKEKQVIKEMTEDTQVENLNKQISTLNESHKQFANEFQNFKSSIADAITSKGEETSENDDVVTMANNIKNITTAQNWTMTINMTVSVGSANDSKLGRVTFNYVITCTNGELSYSTITKNSDWLSANGAWRYGTVTINSVSIAYS